MTHCKECGEKERVSFFLKNITEKILKVQKYNQFLKIVKICETNIISTWNRFCLNLFDTEYNWNKSVSSWNKIVLSQNIFQFTILCNFFYTNHIFVILFKMLNTFHKFPKRNCTTFINSVSQMWTFNYSTSIYYFFLYLILFIILYPEHPHYILYVFLYLFFKFVYHYLYILYKLHMYLYIFFTFTYHHLYIWY